MAAINRHSNRQSAIDTHTNLLELLKATVSSQYDGLRLAIEQNDQQKKPPKNTKNPPKTPKQFLLTFKLHDNFLDLEASFKM